MNKRSALIILFITVITAFFGVDAVAQGGVVTVGGEVEKPLKLDEAAMQQMKQVHVLATAHKDHKQHDYTGVMLSEIIKESGAIPAGQLRGIYLAKYVLVKASDGYQAVIALPEIDTAFTDKVIILANKEDGKPLSNEAGPFQIIVPGDKRPARCVRKVVAINILSAKEN